MGMIVMVYRFTRDITCGQAWNTMTRHRVPAYCLSMIFSKNRYPLFRIML